MKYWKVDRERTQDHWLEVVDSDDDGTWWKAVVKWDGCIHLNHAGNISFDNDPKREDKDCCDNYIHICDLDEIINRLTELRELAKQHFGKEWK